MTTVVSEKIPMGIILVGIALVVIGLIAGAMMSGTNANTDIVSSDNENNVIPENIVTPEKSYAEELLERNTKVLFGADYLEENTRLVKLTARQNNNELVWSTNFEVVPNDQGGMNFRFKDETPENAFYGGLILMWYKTSPNAEIEYSGVKTVRDAKGSIEILDVIPVEWGLVYHETPPPQILKIMSDNDIILHY